MPKISKLVAINFFRRVEKENANPYIYSNFNLTYVHCAVCTVDVTHCYLKCTWFNQTLEKKKNVLNFCLLVGMLLLSVE